MKTLSGLTFVSNNEHKLLEYMEILGIHDLRSIKVKFVEPQSFNVQTVVDEKIKRVLEEHPDDPPCFFVEHTSLAIDAFHGLPGGLIPEFMTTVGNDGICKMLVGFKNQRTARAKVVIGLCYPPKKKIFFEGEVVGRIADRPRGENNFGWDPIFIPNEDPKGRTFAEMSLEEKNQWSMRQKAASGLSQFLRNNFQI